ncbi:MAG TPA: FadR/GntR family transcriptional regulator [Candidatus Dormibacteraeota bacterium]|nr:FadR/GntR family transcriptional regulator [Candidatus Dormibacteraeota bacterium]
MIATVMAETDGRPGQQLITKTSLAAKVADALVAYILQEGMHEGDLLPSTADLAERYGVSRTVVREAIADLAGRGLLQRGQGKETVVLNPGASQLHGLLEFRVLRDGVSAEQVLETRRAIEGITARLAAERRSDDDLATMREALSLMTSAPDDTAYHDADVRFHHQLALSTRNPLIALIFEGIESLVREQRIRATQGRRARGEAFEPIHEAHRAIYDAVARGNPAKAEQAMLAHLMQTEEGLEALRSMRGKGGGASRRGGSAGQRRVAR